MWWLVPITLALSIQETEFEFSLGLQWDPVLVEGGVWKRQTMVLHTYNPQHLESGGRKIRSSRPAWATKALSPKKVLLV